MSIDFELVSEFQPISGSYGVVLPDETAPVVSNSTLSTSTVTTSSFDINFTKASDNESDTSQLQYYLYLSNSNNLTTDASTVETNGTLESQGQDVNTLSVTGLQENSTKWFNIVVADQADNKSIYTQNSETTLTSSVSVSGSKAGDEAALQDFYSSTNGSTWDVNTGWASTGMDLNNTIEGVTTGTINGELRVTEIRLVDNNLTGNINNASFGNLSELTYFNVFFNILSGNIPESIGNCTKLEYLYLNISDYVNDYRTIDPHEYIAQGPAYINHPGKTAGNGPGENGRWNEFDGVLPDTIGNCSALKWLTLNWSRITEWSDELFECTNLVSVGLTRCEQLEVTKQIDPRIGNCTNIIEFLASSTEETPTFTGSPPASMDNLVNMKSLYIQRNKLTSLPDMTGWTDLSTLICTRMDLQGPFPAELINGQKPNFNTLLSGWQDAYFSNWPNGGGWSGELPTSGTHQLYTFGINGHNIGGMFPALITQGNDGIIIIDCKVCDFTHFETSDWTNCHDLRIVRFDDNELTGQWPNLDWATASSMTGLARGRFDNNRFVFSDMLHVPANGGGQTLLQLWQSECETEFGYAPQKQFGSQSALSGNIIDFSNIVTHVNNSYQWQRDGSNIAGSTAILDTGGTAGTYQLIVTNAGAPNLTLNSITITI